MPTPDSFSLVDELHERVIAAYETAGNDWPVNVANVRQAARSATESLPEFKEFWSQQRNEIVERVVDRIIGFGPLEPLLKDPTITEIMVNGCQAVFVERAGQLSRAAVNFSSETEVLQIINRMVGAVGRRIDESSPLVDARLPDGSRVNAIIPPLSKVGPVLTIRRFPAEFWTLAKLAPGALSAAMLEFLRACVLSKQNMVIAGGAGTGKTSLLNALAATVPPAERLITIEDTAEIRLSHPHLVPLEARPPNIEGAGEVTIRTLLKNALRMRPDRIIIGEVRSGEALDMLQAMNTGHRGSLTTVHANSSREALFRLETMALMAEVGLPLAAIREQIKSALNYVIQVERLSDGRRVVAAISEMGLRQETEEDYPYRLRPLFYYDKIQQAFIPAGYLPERMAIFAEAGLAVDSRWFGL